MDSSKAAVPRLRTVDLTYIALFSVLMAVCAWISIPMPKPLVPFTLQTFAVFSAMTALGGRRGLYAVTVYLLLGAVGLPVFAGFQGGASVLLGSTGGYIIGFLASAILFWLLTGQAWPVPPGDNFRLCDGACSLLCLRHGLVFGCLCPDHRPHWPDDRSGLVRVSLCGAGSC